MRWNWRSRMHGFDVECTHWAYPCIGVGRVWVWFGPRIRNWRIRKWTRSPSRRTDSVPTQTALDSTCLISILCVRTSWDTSWLHIRINSCADPNRYWQSGMMVQELQKIHARSITLCWVQWWKPFRDRSISRWGMGIFVQSTIAVPRSRQARRTTHWRSSLPDLVFLI